MRYLIVVLALLCATEARAATISFGTGAFTGQPYSGHVESGFLISPHGSGITVTKPDFDGAGNPLPTTANDFYFSRVDLASLLGVTTFIVSGFDDADGQPPAVFSFGASLDQVDERLLFTAFGFNDFSVTTADANLSVFVFPASGDCQVNLDCSIQRLDIGVVSPSGAFSVDNLCLNGGCATGGGGPTVPSVPEPLSLVLLGVGLAGVAWRESCKSK
jgi:hypothetical protein